MQTVATMPDSIDLLVAMQEHVMVQQNQEQSQAVGAESLVTMEGTKLKLMPGLNVSGAGVRVVSIVGKARMGKSSFLNALISKCSGKNKVVFTTNSGVKHCTFGINYYFIAEHNILLLDSQGLANGDARHDPALLLFIYLVSNVVIFNDSKILQNEALKLLEPICTFATYINNFDAFAKPALIFRLSDGRLVENTAENLQQVMEHHPDQYQSIRESIEEVFLHPIQLVKTETLDRADERFLDNGDYLGLLGVAENGFAATIDYILDVVGKSEPRLNILGRLPEIVEQINSNEKISLEKLDVVGLVHKNDLLEWLQGVDARLKSPIEVDGTQHTYLMKVEARQKEVDAKLKEFDKRFKAVSANIKREQKKKLKAELDEPISKATADCRSLAEAKVAGQVESLEKFSCVLKSGKKAFINKNLSKLKAEQLNGFAMLKEACVSFFSPVKAFYDAWIQRIDDDFTKCVENCRALEQAERDSLQVFCDRLLGEQEEWLKSRIDWLTGNNECLHRTNKVLFDTWSAEQLEIVKTYIKTHMHMRSVTLSVQAQKLTYAIREEPLPGLDHDLVADIYNKFLVDLAAFNAESMTAALNEKKEQLLYNVLFTNPGDGKLIYDSNPDIELVHDAFLLGIAVADYEGRVARGKMPYMTMRTWSSVYEPLYAEALSALIADGVCAVDSDILLFISKENDAARGLTTIGAGAGATLYEDHVRELLRLEMKKLYCRRLVTGLELSLTEVRC